MSSAIRLDSAVATTTHSVTMSLEENGTPAKDSRRGRLLYGVVANHADTKIAWLKQINQLNRQGKREGGQPNIHDQEIKMRREGLDGQRWVGTSGVRGAQGGARDGAARECRGGGG